MILKKKIEEKIDFFHFLIFFLKKVLTILLYYGKLKLILTICIYDMLEKTT